MSLVTRCPNCDTLFRLVPDQLRISQGWVKCGHCSEIFDANKQLVQVRVTASPLEKLPTASEGPSTETILPSRGQPQPANQSPPEVASTHHRNTADKGDDSSSQLHSSPPLSIDANDPSDSEVAPGVVGADALASLPPTPEPEHTSSSPRNTAETNQTKPDIETAINPLGVTSPTFMALGTNERDRNSHVRFLLWLSLPLLVLTLIAQWLYNERNELAATHLQMKPLLAWLCEGMGCRIGAVMRPTEVGVDSAGLQRKGKQIYEFSFTIKNTGNADVVAPAVELTLTNSQEKVLARKVFLQEDLFKAKGPSLNPGAEHQIVLPLQLDFSDGQVIGYRLLTFYP